MGNKPHILIIDDERSIIDFLSMLLKEKGYEVDEGESGEEGIKKVTTNRYDLILVDLMMEKYSGIDVLKVAKQQDYNPEVIIMTAYGSIISAVDAIKLGAFDYITKPFDSKRLAITIEQALERKSLKDEVDLLRKKIDEGLGFGQIIFRSFVMRKVMNTVEMVAQIDSTVLIQGESGTGKELIARAIHQKSSRRERAFIPVNCGALPENLLESELFGYVKGAFTGALHDRNGLFEEADGGTIFLDEIGDMPVSLQIKLLRVLQDGEVRKVGANESKMYDVRIITATNKDLEVLLKEGKFREDLFYRLNVIPLVLPSLRERPEDIPALLIYYLEIYKKKFKRAVEGFEQEAIEFLMNYDWPGNVRELTNLVERTLALTNSRMIKLADISKFIEQEKNPFNNSAETAVLNLQEALQREERNCILKALTKNSWNQTLASKELGISRTSLWRKMKQLGISERP